MSDDRYLVEWKDVRRGFLPGSEPPALLKDFAGWLHGRPWGGVGCFDLSGSLADDAPIVDGSALRREFSLFLHLPDGSVGGFWHPSGAPSPSDPVVGLGSEGEAAVLADSLEGFLARIVLDQFDDGGSWSDFVPHEDRAENQLPALAAWLRERLGRQDLAGLTDIAPRKVSFADRMDAWMHEREAHWASHPGMQALARALDAYRPTDGKPWSCKRFEVAMVGDLYRVNVLDRGPQPIPEAAAIAPILRALREEQASLHPDHGLWFAMEFSLTGAGAGTPRFDYQARPAIGGAPAPVDQGRADLARAPRPERWVPAWLRTS